MNHHYHQDSETLSAHRPNSHFTTSRFFQDICHNVLHSGPAQWLLHGGSHRWRVGSCRRESCDGETENVDALGWQSLSLKNLLRAGFKRNPVFFSFAKCLMYLGICSQLVRWRKLWGHSSKVCIHPLKVIISCMMFNQNFKNELSLCLHRGHWWRLERLWRQNKPLISCNIKSKIMIQSTCLSISL